MFPNYPIMNRLSGGVAFPPVRRPLLGQEMDIISIQARSVGRYMGRLLADSDCLDKLASEYGRSSIDALMNKAAEQMKVDPSGYIGLNSREITIYEEAKACVNAPNLWILIPLISGAVLFAVVGVGALIEAANRPQHPSDSKPSRGKEWSQKDPPWG